MDWVTFLKIGHIVGTVLGAGGATFAEIQFREAAKDGQVDASESRLLRLTYQVIRVGLVLIVLSGFGYLLYFRIAGFEERLYSPRLWAKLMITGVLVANAFLLHVRRIPIWAGAGVSIVSWYAALVLGAWRSLDASFWMMMFWYVVIVLLVLPLMRAWHRPPQQP